MAPIPERKIGYLMSEKKWQKINPAVFSVFCRNHGFTLERIDIERPLEEQGPFAVILNKLTDVVTEAEAGCEKSKQLIHNFESYVRLHPEVVVLDPLEKVRCLLSRPHYYRMLQRSGLKTDRCFTPSFVELSSTDVTENVESLRKAGVAFPFVCKSTNAHGNKSAHDMIVVFNAEGVKDCQPPCVAQSFINHNATLYKIFILGKRYHMTLRPSLKNFYPCGYEGFPNYLEALMECILEKTASNSQKMNTNTKELMGDDSGFDTGDSSDEKNKRAHLNLNRCKKSITRFPARPEVSHH